ncbi:MAG: hypothetical protein SGI71_05845 [Verrucomicrobiota bacterium]|nr:hypothetical protein [Verrucomicrobiota bacterium]
MSLFGKIFTVIALLTSVACLWLGFQLSSTRKQDKAKYVETTTKLSNTEEEKTKAEKLAADTQTLVEQKSKEIEEATAQAAALKKAKEETEGKLTALQADKSKIEADIKEKQAELEKLRADAEKVPGLETQIAEKEIQIKLLAEEKQLVTDGLMKTQKELEILQDKERRRLAGVLPIGTRGKIEQVNLQWNFVVLNIGEADQLVEGAQMLIYRGATLLGKVKIRSVEKKSSIADIIAITDAAKTKEGRVIIQPGDEVLF